MIVLLYLRADDYGVDLSSTEVLGKCSAACRRTAVSVLPFVPRHDQHSVSAGLKRRTCKKRPDVRLQPGIGGRERPVMRIIPQRRGYEGVIRQSAIGNVCGELRHRHDIERFTAVGDVNEIRERIMPLHINAVVRSRTTTGGKIEPCIAGGRDPFLVGLPSQSRGFEMAHDVVDVERQLRVVIIRHKLAGGQPHVIGNGIVAIGKGVDEQSILCRQAIQVGHLPHHSFVAVVLFQDDIDVLRLRHLRQQRKAAEKRKQKRKNFLHIPPGRDSRKVKADRTFLDCMQTTTKPQRGIPESR